MKRLLTIWAAGFILIAITGLAAADNALPSPRAGEDRTVYATCGNWESYPSELVDVPYANACDVLPPLQIFEGRENIIELNGDYELTFDMPNFVVGDYKEVCIQVTCYPQGMTNPVFIDCEEWKDDLGYKGLKFSSLAKSRMGRNFAELFHWQW
ncbi:MAG: hypothetical protein WAK60_03060 [Sedimentisphaerales bacterium]